MLAPSFIFLLTAMIHLKEKMRLLHYFSLHQTKNLSKLLIQFISKHIKNPPDILHRGAFFSKLYDEVYHELASKQVTIQKKVWRILEFLALPIEHHSEEQLALCCNQIRKVRKEIYKEDLKKKLKK